MPCSCKILYRDIDVILLKYKHGCLEHEDWCRNEAHNRYIRSSDGVLVCECGRRAFVEEVSPSASDSTPQPKILLNIIERLNAVQCIVSSACTEEEAKCAYDELDNIIAKLSGGA